MAEELIISQLAEEAGVSKRTIRYYVTLGLLPPPKGSGPRRLYGPKHILGLKLIRRLKALRLSLAEIARLLLRLDPSGMEYLERKLAQRLPDVNLSGELVENELAREQLRLSLEEIVASSVELSGSGERGFTSQTEVWRRVRLAGDVELHYRVSSDPARQAALSHLLETLRRLLAGQGALLPPEDVGKRETGQYPPGEERIEF